MAVCGASTHGPDKLSMLLCVEGHHYRTRRVRQVHDGMAHQTTVDSGDLEPLRVRVSTWGQRDDRP